MTIGMFLFVPIFWEVIFDSIMYTPYILVYRPSLLFWIETGHLFI